MSSPCPVPAKISFEDAIAEQEGETRRQSRASGGQVSSPASRSRSLGKMEGLTRVLSFRKNRSFSSKAAVSPDETPRSILGRRNTAWARKYPMWLLPMKTFFELSDFVVHQDLLERGALVEYDPCLHDGRVVFVSHQWSSFDLPDPSGEQFHCLKTALQRLASGHIKKVKSTTFSKHYVSYSISVDGKTWKKTLPDMFIWFDFMSIPQPAVEQMRMNGSWSSEHGRRTSDHRIASGRRMNKDGEHDEMSTASRDAAEATVDKIDHLAKGLCDAVDSIASYVECASLVIILAPPVKHGDLDDTYCDLRSWYVTARLTGCTHASPALQRLYCSFRLISTSLTHVPRPPASLLLPRRHH